MSREVDERVVAMYFDNSEFEKNVKSTINTLDDLKKNLDLEKSARGFDTLKKAAQELKLEDLDRKVRNLQGTFQGLGNVVKNAFNIGTGPLKSLDNLFSSFQGYVTKFIGFDLAGKFVNSFESAVRELTIAPVTSGWSEYELKMDSIKTIMSGTGESLEVVKNKLEILNHYADKTIYSFSDMTSNIGKFTNNGVKLDDATDAIQGIANAAADAGQGAAEASRAMYNLSQAMSVGSLKLVDWKSLENANMATSKLKQTFIDAAVANGTLQKSIEKDKKTGKEETKYYVIDKDTGKVKTTGKGKSAKKVEVTVDNLRETLNEEWLNNETMLDTFKIFSGELKTIEDLKRMGFNEVTGFTDDDLKKLIAIGEEAMKAATEVRTFSKMWDALKEAAQSGWATTMEFIFGDMEEGTNLWTSLNDKIGGLLEKMAEARNDAFAKWRGMYKKDDGTYGKYTDLWVWVYEEDENGVEHHYRKKWEDVNGTIQDGRQILVDSFMEFIDVLGSIGSTVSSAWESVFGGLTGEKLMALTNGFKEFVDKLKSWLGAADDSNSRLSKLGKGLRGVFSILKLVINAVKSGIGVIWKVAKPFVNAALEAFGKFGEFFDGIGDMKLGDALKKITEKFSELWNKVRGMSWDDVKSRFTSAWTGIKDAVREWFYDNGLGDAWNKLSEWKEKFVSGFESIKARIAEVWDGIVQWFEDSGIAGFFRDAWGWIKKQFGFTTGSDFVPEGYKGNVDLTNRPQVPIEVVAKAEWVDENGNPFDGDYATLLSQTFSAGDTSNGYDYEYDENVVLNVTPITPEGKVLTPAELEDYLWDVIENAKKKGISILESDQEGNGAYSNLLLGVDPVEDGNLEEAYEKAEAWTIKLHELQEEWDKTRDPGYKSPVETLLNSIIEGVGGAWETVSGWSGWEEIANFFGNIWEWLKDKATKGWDVITSFFGTTEDGEESGFVKTLKSIKSTVKEVWDGIVKWFTDSGIVQFFTDVWGWITGLFSGKSSETDRRKPTDAIADAIQNGHLIAIAGVSDVGMGGAKSDTHEAPFVTWLRETRDSIVRIWDEITGWSGWTEIGNFFGNIWEWLKNTAGVVWDTTSSFFTVEENGESGFTKLIGNVTGWVDEKWKALIGLDIWPAIGNFFGNIWEWLKGTATNGWNAAKSFFGTSGDGEEGEESGFIKTLESIKETVSATWGEIETWFRESGIADFFGDIWGWISGLFSGESSTESTGEVDEESIGLFERIMGVISDFLGKIGEIIGKATGEGTLASEVLGNLRMLFETVHEILSLFVGLIHDAVVNKDAAAQWEIIGGTLVTIIGAITANRLKTSLAKAVGDSEGVGETLLKLAAAIGIISLAVAGLGSLDQDTLDKGTASLWQIGTLLAGLYIVFNVFKKEKTKVEEARITGWERFGNNIVDAIGKIGMIWIAMKELPNVINAMKDSNVKGEDIMQVITAMMELIGGIGLITALVNKLGGNNAAAMAESAIGIVAASAIIITGFEALLGLMGSISNIAGTISGEGQEKNLEDTLATIGRGGQILTAISEALGSFVAGFTVAGFTVGWSKEMQKGSLEQAQENMEWLSEMTQEFAPSRMIELGRMAQAIATLTEAIPSTFSMDRVTKFTDELPKLGGALAQFALGFKQAFYKDGIVLGDAETELTNALRQVEYITKLAESMSEFQSMFQFGFDRTKMGFNTDSFVEVTPDDFATLGRLYAQAAAALAVAVDQGLSENGIDGMSLKFDATPIVDSIVIALGYGETAIAEAVHAMVQAGIDHSDSPDGSDGYNTDIITQLMNGGMTGGVESVVESLGLNGLEGILSGQLYGTNGEGGIIGTLNGFMTDMEGYDFTGMLDFSTMLKDKDGNDLDITTIQSDLQEYLDSISTGMEGVNEAMEIRVRPVFEMTDLQAGIDTINSYFAENPIAVNIAGNIPTFNFSSDNTDVVNKLASVQESIVALNSQMQAENRVNTQAIRSMTSEIDKIANAVKSIKIYLDTGVIAGAVDTALGYSSFIAGRTGT